ncbi:MAG: Nif11 family protein [Clostridiales bacterium]|nr:Nif11 family protein [Clostridiales bacterium]
MNRELELFIEKVIADPELEKRLNECTSMEEIAAIAASILIFDIISNISIMKSGIFFDNPISLSYLSFNVPLRFFNSLFSL